MKKIHDTDPNGNIKCKVITASALLIMGNVLHLLMMPFCPLVLLATNSATAIVMSAALAVYCLGEKIQWIYDTIAFILISSGTTAMVLLSKENEQSFNAVEVRNQLKSVNTITFAILYFFFMFVNYLITSWIRT